VLQIVVAHVALAWCRAFTVRICSARRQG
jgi:hypothetical protein